jgi:uncharacterized protein
MFPLGTVLFPGEIAPLHIFEPRYRQMMTDCLEGDGSFGVVLISRGSEVGGGDQRVAVGTEARITDASRFEDGRWAVLARGIRRVVASSWLPDDPYPVAIVRALPAAGRAAEPDVVDNAATTLRQAWALLSELGRASAPSGSAVSRVAPDDPAARVWQLCASAPIGPLDRQRLLEIDDATQRASHLNDLTMQVIDDLHRMLASGS